MTHSPIHQESLSLVATLLAAAALGACTPQEVPGTGDPTNGAPNGASESAAPVLETSQLTPPVLYQAVSAASAEVVWLAGHEGRWARSEDGGETWATGDVPGHGQREFRDVYAFDALQAVLMSAGPGDLSRIFVTEDGGTSWQQTFVMEHPDGFLDCLDFWDRDRGVAFGDAVDGRLYLLVTDDGGESWRRLDPGGLPSALGDEGGFAASGTCLRAGPGDRGWVATGNGTQPRLLATGDRGDSWEAADLPLAAGAGRGATTVEVRPDGLGFALGGDVGASEAGPRVALTADGGLSWSAVGDVPFPGAAYGAAWVPDREPATVFAVGPGGIGWSRDGGMNWALVDTLPHWAVAFGSSSRGWAVGPEGRVTRILIPDSPY